MMSEPKFTPGPWVFDPETTTATVWEGMSPSGSGRPGRLVAQVCGDDAFVEANALLIAAAPEMYEFIRSLAKQYEGTDAPTGIRAAEIITKAEGRSL